MKKLWQNCKGMVTVMVTLLLIPSLLVTGSAVDIARIYAAKSVLQDANQLAANSTLASYDALLQDLYGLYGIMDSDPELADMINKYIQVSVLGQDGQGKGLGTFQLLYGSELKPGTITPASGQNLGNTEVLRRQIEEYSKFRVPVVLVDELLDRLNGFEKVQKDAEVIEEKMDLDDGLEDLSKVYEDLYDKINEVNRALADVDIGYSKINDAIDSINEQISDMLKVRNQYTEYVMSHQDAEDATAEDIAHWEEVEKDYETRYKGIQDNVRALVRGGTVYNAWVQGRWEDEEARIWSPGHFSETNTTKIDSGLKKLISDARKLCDALSDGLDDLIKLAEKADKKKEELKKKLDDLETKLNTPDSCSDDLKKSLDTPTEGNGNKSALDVYRDALKYDVTPMAQAVVGENAPVLEAARKLLDNPVYGDWKYDGPTLPIAALEELKSTAGFELDLDVYNKTHTTQREDVLDAIDMGPSLCHYEYSGSFKLFQDPKAFSSTRNPEFYQLLVDMFGGETTKAKKSTAKKAATRIFAEAQDMFQGITNYEPEGAWVYTPPSGGGAEAPEENFGQEGDWSKEGEGKNKAKEALSGSLVQRLGSIADKSANHLLLLGYDSEMFSCFTTNKGSETGRKTMAGIPFGIDVNYFYQSELEFLYAGSYNAQDNLKSVAGMIFLVRFVFNYIASFNIPEINDMVDAVKSALSGIAGPFAFIIGELVRVGYALGESALDVGRLRQGHMVKLFKDEKTWRFSLTGLINSAGDGLSENISFGEKNNSNLDDEGLDAFSYRDYLRVFLLLKSDADLAQGTRTLIELNMTNYQNSIGGKGDHKAREEAMSGVERVNLSRAITGFTLTTEVELRMLFLSMPVAQKGVNGVIPPGSVPISVSDYRGY